MTLLIILYWLCEGDIMFLRILKAHDFHFASGDFLNFERLFGGSQWPDI